MFEYKIALLVCAFRDSAFMTKQSSGEMLQNEKNDKCFASTCDDERYMRKSQRLRKEKLWGNADFTLSLAFASC